MKTSIFAAVFVVFSAFPGYSGGSMAPESRIIVVRPAPAIRRQAEIRRMEKDRLAAEKAEIKAAERAERAAEKDRAAATKAYEKRLAAQRKKKTK